MTDEFRGYHDIGGRPAGPIVKDSFPFEDWQRRGEAMRVALERKNALISLDELRRGFETFGEELYSTLGFYERRAESFVMLLEEKGILRRDEAEARMDALAREAGRTVDHASRTVSEA